MARERFEFVMPASCEVVFDAFHYHRWRRRWDSLVDATHVLGGAECPYVGAISRNAGGGILRGLSMTTRFISFERAKVAAATMQGESFPFSRWAASMRHHELDGGRSVMVYTYAFDVRAGPLAWLLRPITKRIFDWQTKRRFEHMRRFLESNAAEVIRWQRAREGMP